MYTHGYQRYEHGSQRAERIRLASQRREVREASVLLAARRDTRADVDATVDGMLLRCLPVVGNLLAVKPAEANDEIAAERPIGVLVSQSPSHSIR